MEQYKIKGSYMHNNKDNLHNLNTNLCFYLFRKSTIAY